MWFFKVTLRDVLALVAFIPLITGMGGNVGLQSSSIMVRGIATEKFGLTSLMTILFKEIRVAIIMGIICGGTVGAVAFFWQAKASLGLVVGFAMIISMVVASSMGVLAPAFFQKIKVDPAVASGPLVTTANDITGIIIYLGIATAFLKFLY
jgi:magnesium transporter